MNATTSVTRRILHEVVWHFVVLATTLSAVSYFHGVPFWLVGAAMDQVYLLCLGYLATVVAVRLVGWLRLEGLILPSAGYAAVAGLLFLSLLLAPRQFDKLDLLASFAILGGAITLFYVIPRFRLLWTVGYASILLALLILLVRPASQEFVAEGEIGFVSKAYRTSVYDLDVRIFESVVPQPRTHMGMGALERVDDAYLVALANGDIYSVRGLGSSPTVTVTKWKTDTPLNYDEFLATAQNQTFSQYFRITDILVKQNGEQSVLYLAHHHWSPADSCATLRISMVEFDSLSQLEDAQLEWSTVFDTSPCFGLVDEPWAFRGMEGGGRLALLNDHELLMTVGDHGFNGVDFDTNWVDDPGSSYGKTVSVDLTSGEARTFTTGHRNQQGLFVTSNGLVWSTEHGPEGGDELNLLVSGGYYGWPNLTYGTDYGSLEWPVPRPADESRYRLPGFAWVPSIGISSLTSVPGAPFDRWKDDLLIGSLVGRSLFRVHIDGEAVRYVEPIELGERLRDVIADENGIVIWTDSRSMIHISPAP